MPLDYSKWDKLELSDDDDFECQLSTVIQLQNLTTPNVDKASMIRWKQAKIHSDRRDVKDTVSALKLELEAWSKITPMIQEKEPYSEIESVLATLGHDIMNIRIQDRDPRWGPMEPIPILESRPRVLDNLENARQVIEKRVSEIEKEIQTLEQEQIKRLTVEDMKEGFSKTIMNSASSNKQSDSTSSGADDSKTTSTKQKAIEVIHSPSATNKSLKKNPVDEGEEPMITDPFADHFSFLTDFGESFDFIRQHSHIVTQDFSDQLLAQAFRHGLSNNQKRLRGCVVQALILQYCSLLGKDGIALFFKRMETKAEKANELFYKDVNDTTTKIQNRVKEIQKEHSEQEQLETQQAELRYNAALQPDGSLKLPIDEIEDPSSVERARVFDQLPRALQEGLLKSDVELINKGIQLLDQDRAGEIMQECARVGLIMMDEHDEDEADQE